MSPGRAASPRASGVSLWLVPEAEPAAQLSGLLARLSSRLGTPAFAPHVTLLPGLLQPEAELLRACAALARETPPVDLRLSRLDSRDEFFRCLFLAAEPTPSLLAARSRAEALFERRDDPPYEPHLSLVYGMLPSPLKAVLAAELATGVWHFTARRLDLVRTEGEVVAWRLLESFTLRG